MRHCTTTRKVAGSIHVGVIGNFVDIILAAALWSWGRLSLYRRGGKGGQCVRLTTLPPSFAERYYTKSGNLNLLEPSGPVQAQTLPAFTHIHATYFGQFMCPLSDCHTRLTKVYFVLGRGFRFTNSDYHILFVLVFPVVNVTIYVRM